MTNFKHALMLTVALGVGGCMTQQQAAVVPAPVRPVVVAPAPSQGRLLNKTALAGSTLEVEHITALNPDCTIAGHMAVRMTQEPVHGKVQIVDREIFPTYPAANPRSACNVRKVPGTAVDYTPAPGFAGSDFLAYDIISYDGRDIPTKAAITVK